MRKLITHLIFVTVSLLVILAFITAKSYSQLAFATLLYPPVAYLGWKLYLRKQKKNKPAEVIQPEVVIPAAKEEIGGILDINRREFLRLIGAAGLSFFLFSIFTRRSEALFFGRASEPTQTNLLDSANNKIDPAQRQPTDGYQISEIEDGDSPHYGFIHKSGAWYIMKATAEGSFRYVRGESDFPTHWANHKRLKYDYFHNVFQ